MLVAIHQPNFLPWLGYFDKISRADRFVVLDSVPLQLTGGNYTNRVKMIISGKPSWVTMPLRRGHEARSCIDQAEYITDATARRKILRSIAQSYAKAPFFSSVMPLVEKIFGLETTSLVEFNLNGIYAVAERLGLSTAHFVRSSTMDVEGHSNELLADIVRAAGGDTYLAGHGADGYQDDSVFAANGIAVNYQAYVHPAYRQSNVDQFVPGMSAIDALMNCGPDAATLIGSKQN
jgi:hypothetical protein